MVEPREIEFPGADSAREGVTTDGGPTAELPPSAARFVRHVVQAGPVIWLLSLAMQKLDTMHLDGFPSVRPLAVRVPEACRLTGIGRSKLHSGEISIVKIGAMTLISMAELERFLAAHGGSR